MGRLNKMPVFLTVLTKLFERAWGTSDVRTRAKGIERVAKGIESFADRVFLNYFRPRFIRHRGRYALEMGRMGEVRTTQMGRVSSHICGGWHALVRN